MKNDELLLRKNSSVIDLKKIKVLNGKIVFKNTFEKFDGHTIKRILSFVNTMNYKYPNVKIPVIFDLGDIYFADKLTYVFFEIICYILIKRYGHLVRVIFRCKHNIFTEGIESSPLLLLNELNKQNMLKFLDKFDDELYKNHYRKLMKQNENKMELSKRMDDISYFLKFSGVEEKCIDEISEVIVELIGNAWEHASPDCLVDIDVTNSYFKEKSEREFLGVNIAVINFSENLLGDSVKTKISDNNITLTDRYLSVRNAYEKHKKFFDSKYQEEDFFNIASFQHKISGRKEKITTGGTGLTKLISSLEKRSDSHNCYIITGNRVLWFHHKYLEYNPQGWIGFNDNNDFFTSPPKIGILGINSIYMPGTAYNLNFVLKRREQ